MKFDIKNGILEIGHFSFDSNFTEEKVETQFFEKIFSKTNFTSYLNSNIDNGESSVLLHFESQKLKCIEIRAGKNYKTSPFMIENKERKLLDNYFQLLGRGQNYKWGSSRLIDDQKGGSLSILVKYESLRT